MEMERKKQCHLVRNLPRPCLDDGLYEAMKQLKILQRCTMISQLCVRASVSRSVTCPSISDLVNEAKSQRKHPKFYDWTVVTVLNDGRCIASSN